MVDLSDVVLGHRHGSGGLLPAYVRWLRLINGLASGPAMSWVTGRVQACLNPDRLRTLSVDPLVTLVRQRIRDADELDRMLLRHLCSVGESEEIDTDSQIFRALADVRPSQEPLDSLRSVMVTEQQISDIWVEALEMPDLPRFDMSLQRQATDGRADSVAYWRSVRPWHEAVQMGLRHTSW